jgi:hypothetical protein
MMVKGIHIEKPAQKWKNRLANMGGKLMLFGKSQTCCVKLPISSDFFPWGFTLSGPAFLVNTLS